MPKLSVIIPVYNEAKTINDIVQKVNAIPIDKEIIVIDDGSADGTDRILREIRLDNLKVIFHGSNRGKGSALLTGIANATADFVIIQDADLEYDPQDYPKLIAEMQSGLYDLILGVRFTQGYHGLLIPRLGNQFLTGLINILFGTKINDFFTCYKLARRDMLNALKLGSKGFEIDTEIVIKSIKKGLRIKEVPISYYPRNYSQGKKIRIFDGLYFILLILMYKFFTKKDV
ncbi:MAG: glycosyltransferase family 2 protein [Candidatus Omnitrophica bacterium]|nr:glycosyltransferase family 2 protein [Candidatus Omnitrophota bacterium]